MADASVMDCLVAYRTDPARVRQDAVEVDLFRLLHDALARHVSQTFARSRRVAMPPVPAIAGANHAPYLPEPVPDASALENERGGDRLPGILGRLQALPPNQRQVLTLVSVEGFSVEECSQVLGVPAHRVGTLLAEARRHLAALQDPL
ncbi:MAG: sigma factor-like helix-turn-helix DNA-binding protein [Rhodospirillaceae bacterium]